jgi:predicted O-methyltransferase YrrM
LALLRQSPHPLAQQLTRVWTEYVADASPEAASWSERVEEERRRLGSSGSQTTGIDGAPRPIAKAVESSKRRSEGLFLYGLVRVRGPARILEMGTNVGISSAYLAGAQQAALAGGATPLLVTLEGFAERVEAARAMHRRLGLKHVEYVAGQFSDTLAGALERHAPFDLAFIDGDHQYEPTLRYFEQVLAHASQDALLVFDDIHWSLGMERAWGQIRRDRRVRLAVEVGRMGLCALGGPASTRYRAPSLYLRG